MAKVLVSDKYLNLFVLSYLRTIKSIPKYWLVVNNRKGTIAVTRGYVNGSFEDFQELRENDVRLLKALASEDEVEIYEMITNLQARNINEVYCCEVTFESGRAAYTSSIGLQNLLENAFSFNTPVHVTINSINDNEIIGVSLDKKINKLLN